MIGVEDEEQVERLGHLRVDLVGLRRHREHHVQQVRRVAEVVARVDVRLADRLLERPGRQRRQLGDEPVDGDLDRVRIEDVLAVGVEGAHADDARGEHRHRVRIGGEGVEEVPHLLADEGVMRHLAAEPIELLAGRQLAPDQQVGDLQEGRALGQLLDRIAAIAEDALLPVEEGDGAGARAGVAVAGVVGDEPGLAAQPPDVDRVVTLGAAHQRQLHLPVADAQRGASVRVAASVLMPRSSSTAARSSSSSSVVAVDLRPRELAVLDALHDLDAPGRGGAQRDIRRPGPPARRSRPPPAPGWRR